MVRVASTLVCALVAATSLALGAPVPEPRSHHHYRLPRPSWLSWPFSRADAAPTLAMPNKLGNLAAFDMGNGAYRLTVPYAQAPVGPLRFANPQPITTLSAGFDPTKTAPSCYQGDTAPRGGNTPSEDCLYLTVYFPKTMTPSSKLPIFMWMPNRRQ